MIFVNPLVLFLAVWGGTFFLFSLHLSTLLIDDPASTFLLFVNITIPFIGSYLIVSFARSAASRVGNLSDGRAEYSQMIESRFGQLRRKLFIFSCAWVCISIFETIVSKGLPLYWYFVGSDLTYADFGIPSLHGLTNSLLLASAMLSQAMFLHSKKPSFLIMPAICIAWSVVVVSRNLLLVTLLQGFILWLRFYATHAGKTMLRLFLVGLVVLYVFGVIGDLRTGADTFVSLAQPTFELPPWLPSGFFWAYMYITSPLNNVAFNLIHVSPLYSPAFPNTLLLLLPSVIRQAILPADAGPGDLVSEAFNVGSAFIGPFQDMGLPGVFVYSAVCGGISSIFWYKRSFSGYFGYCVLGQCIFFSNFYNHFLYLPILFQFFWIFVYDRQFSLKSSPHV